MTATCTDLFCGAGGSSLGATAAGMQLVLGANHWAIAIDVHQAHFPDAGHDCADISQVDPRRYPRTDVLLASPECTNHANSKGVGRRRQDPTLWDAPDPASERSRATMWDVVRFAECHRYDAVVVENVVEATGWVGWRGWHVAMEDLGYEHRVLSHNSMHHGVPQSRDRIYVVFWRKGLRPDLELELKAYCGRCDAVRVVRQGWKNGRAVGRYRQQWVWVCTTCGGPCEPATRPAADVIDWSLPALRIGDRPRPLAAATQARILDGLRRYGWAPSPESDRPALMVPLRRNGHAHPVARVLPTVTAGGSHHALLTAGRAPILVPYNGKGVARSAAEPLGTQPTRDRWALVDPEAVVDDCGFRMLEPHEIAAAMAFPERYIPLSGLTKKDRVKLAGNAVTPPVMEWIAGRVLHALAEAGG